MQPCRYIILTNDKAPVYISAGTLLTLLRKRFKFNAKSRPNTFSGTFHICCIIGGLLY